MAYCASSDLTSLLTGFKLTTTSVPSTTQVDSDIIPLNDGLINDRLAKFYVVPITGTKSLATMKRISSWLSAADISDRIYMGESPSNSPQAATWRGMAEAELNRICAGEIILSDAVPTSDTPEPLSAQISDYLSQPTYQNPPRFSMGMKF